MNKVSATVKTWDPEAARGLADVVCGMYEAVFREPPFNGDAQEFANQQNYYRPMTGRRGFRLATGEVDGQVAGFGYGYLLPADTSWWDGLDEPVPAEVARETGQRTFVLIDFGVLPTWQYRGIGHAIHDELLGGSGAERATLSVQPKAVKTEETYFRWGWHRAGHKTMPQPSPFPEFDILLLDAVPPLRR